MPPKVKIPIHVFTFGLASIPGVAYAIYWSRNHENDEQFEDKLKQNYGGNIQGNRDKRKEMVIFFEAMKDPSANKEQEQKMMQVLHGGRGEIKRHHAVDEKLYGTEEGVEQKKLADEKQLITQGGKAEKIKTRKKNKKRKKKKVNDEINNEKSEMKTERESQMLSLTQSKYVQNTAVSLAAVGTLAILTSLISGKKGS